MKRVAPFLFILVLIAAFVPAWSQDQLVLSPQIQVFFSPKGGCTEAVVKEVGAARTSILVQAYSFTSAPIAKALLDAHKRGVKVQVILDKSNRSEKYSSADFVQHAGIPIFIDAKHAIAHNKIIIIDGQVVITGSFNFTKNAEENNAENLLVIRDSGLAEKYTANWKDHLEHSDVYEPKEKGYSETHRDPTSKPADKDRNIPPGGYVASRNSHVFHKPNCKSALKISEKNLVKYATRDEAIHAEKKPCAECQP